MTLIIDGMGMDRLWNDVQVLQDTHFPNHSLKPVLGIGNVSHPRFLFLFINPIVQNISSSHKLNGPQFPFIDTKQVWRVFHSSGLLDDSLMSAIEDDGWTVEVAERVETFFVSAGMYLTSVVKFVGLDGELAEGKTSTLFLPLLLKEIEVVKPDFIVTFGSIPFNALTGENINIDKYYETVMSRGSLGYFDLECGRIVPCYNPAEGDNLLRAVEMLTLLSRRT